jgi:hypothetical protein
MRFVVVASIAFVCACPGYDDGFEGEGEGEEEVERTWVWRELTAQTDVDVLSTSLSIAADTNRISYAIRNDQNRTFVVDPTGTPSQIDAYTPGCGCNSDSSISSDGGLVAIWDPLTLRVVDPNGGGVLGSVVVDQGSIVEAVIDDNDVTYYLQDRDANALDGFKQRGVWKLERSSSTPEQVVGPEQVRAVLGLAIIDDIPFFGAAQGVTLGVSGDGTRLTFAAFHTGGASIFGYDTTTTTLRQLIGTVGAAQTAGLPIRHAAINRNGDVVAYDVGNEPGLADPTEIGRINFDGTNRVVITTTPPTLGAQLAFPNLLSPSGDKLLISTTGDLFDTNDNSVLQLPVRGGFFSSDPPQLADGFGYVMNATADHFAFVDFAANGRAQLASLLIDPDDLGDAPVITEPFIDRDTIPRDGVTVAAVRARVSGEGIIRVSTSMALDGRPNNSGNSFSNDVVLLDDDGDGVFENNTDITARELATTGTYVVSIKAESSVNGLRRATMVDFAEITVE